MIEPGKILQQRYLIRKQIGQGGMGAVYVATDERFNSTVAIKETLLMDDHYRRAIEREARLLNSLKHAALPRVTDHFLEDNGQFLVMEYIPGDDLYCILERESKPFPVDKVMEWADQLLDALDFLHNQENPVIHRDIKPQNLKLNARGQIILLDFGLAKGNPTDADHQTAAKSIFGYSRNYASLEQIQGTGTDPRSDLYSLAATLYHLATCVPPADALTRAMTVLGQNADPLLPANAVDAAVPAGFAGVLHNAMDLNAAMRPASAAEMRTMLRESEKYAHLAETPLQPVTVVQTDVLTQKTKLMPGTTRHGQLNPTAVGTEVLPSLDSELTAVRPPVSGGSTRAGAAAFDTQNGKRGWGAGAIAIAVLLLAGIAAGGAFMFDPTFFGLMNDDKADAQQLNEVPAAEQSPAPIEASSAPAAEPDPSASQSETVVADAAPVESAPAPKAAAPVRQAKSQPGTKQRSTDPNDVVIDGETMYFGNMKITEDKIETPDTIIDENGVRRKLRVNPKINPVHPIPPGTTYLTPEQIEKLKSIRQRAIENALKPTPPKP